MKFLLVPFIFLASGLLPVVAEAKWTVNSQFQLLLKETFFDQVIGDFWSALQGTQKIDIQDIATTAQGIPVYIQGVRAEVDYDFPLPKRAGTSQREWDLETKNLSARLFVDQIHATGQTIRIINGIEVSIDVEAQCKDLVMRLAPGQSHVKARVRAEVADNKVQLTLPSYEADWTKGAWEVESVSCTGVDRFEEVVKREALKALSSFQNIDEPVHREITNRFQQWSEEATGLLLSAQEIPTGKDYLKTYWEPAAAAEHGDGLLLSGNLRFEYPNVSPDHDEERTHLLAATRSAKDVSFNAGNILLPFETVRSLLEGQYRAGALQQKTLSSAIPAFQAVQQDRWTQFWIFPELGRYPTNAVFQFQFHPTATPGFQNERAGANGAILGDLNLPLAIQMDANLQEGFVPMVEFRTLLNGPSSLTLKDGGNVTFSVQPATQPVTYGWEQHYQATYHPDTRIAADTVATQVRSALSGQAFQLTIPSLNFGALSLSPSSWGLEGKNVRVQFTGKSASAEKLGKAQLDPARLRRAIQQHRSLR